MLGLGYNNCVYKFIRFHPMPHSSTAASAAAAAVTWQHINAWCVVYLCTIRCCHPLVERDKHAVDATINTISYTLTQHTAMFGWGSKLQCCCFCCCLFFFFSCFSYYRCDIPVVVGCRRAPPPATHNNMYIKSM